MGTLLDAFNVPDQEKLKNGSYGRAELHYWHIARTYVASVSINRAFTRNKLSVAICNAFRSVFGAALTITWQNY